MAKLLLLAFITLGIYTYTVNGEIKCYSCNPCSEDPKSWDVLPSCGKSATPNPAACAKIIKTDKISGKETISRNCVILEKTATGVHFPCNSDKTTDKKCETCLTDLCNRGTTFKISAFVGIGLILIFLVGR